MELSERLRYYRKSIGLTQEDFANKLGIKQGSYSDIERGKVKKLSDSVFALLKMVYNLNPNWVLRGEDPMLISDFKENNIKLEPTTSREAANEIERRMYQERIDYLEEKYREALIEIGELRNKNKMRDEK